MFRQYVSWTSKGVHRFHQRRRVAARGGDQLEMLKNGAWCFFKVWKDQLVVGDFGFRSAKWKWFNDFVGKSVGDGVPEIGGTPNATEIGENASIFDVIRRETVRPQRRICCGTCSFQKVIPTQCLSICAKRWALDLDDFLVFVGLRVINDLENMFDRYFWRHFSKWLWILGCGFIHLLQGLVFAWCGGWLSKADRTLAPDLEDRHVNSEKKARNGVIRKWLKHLRIFYQYHLLLFATLERSWVCYFGAMSMVWAMPRVLQFRQCWPTFSWPRWIVWLVWWQAGDLGVSFWEAQMGGGKPSRSLKFCWDGQVHQHIQHVNGIIQHSNQMCFGDII